MTNDPNIQAQSYYYFTLEAPELLNTLEQELLSLQEGESNINRINNMMRTTHTLKGIAATVGLETIKDVTHSLEDIFKALCKPELIVDKEIKALLFEGYECLRSPLIAAINGSPLEDKNIFDRTAAIFNQLQDKLGDLFTSESTLPSAEDLGIDLTKMMFEITVVQELEKFELAIADAKPDEIGYLLSIQAQTFLGIGESTQLQGFIDISKAVLVALELHPERVADIIDFALQDWRQGKDGVLAGDRTSGGNPSQELLQLANWEKNVAETPVVEMPTTMQDTVEVSTIEPEESNNNQLARSLETLAGTWGEALDSEETSASDTDRNELSQSLEALAGAWGEAIEIVNPEPVKVETTQVEAKTVTVDVSVTPVAAAQNPQMQPKIGVNNQFKRSTANKEKVADISSSKSTKMNIENNSQNPEPKRQRMVRVDVDRLEKLNYFNAELLTNQNRQLLQDDNMRGLLRKFLNRLRQIQQTLSNLQEWSEPLTLRDNYLDSTRVSNTENFDALELDSYNEFHVFIQSLMEESIQLERDTDSLDRLSRQNSQLLNKQRKLLTNSRDVLIEARMMPLGDILNRFHRVLQQLETTHKKTVNLTIEGSDVLVDKAVAEKLYDPLLHLIRNAFDHGIESSESRQQKNKSECGKIEIHGYYRGSQLIIDVRDDGQGLNFEKIRQRAIENGLITAETSYSLAESQLAELLFEPGFSTNNQVNDLSGRGVGLDVVLVQLQSVQGSVSVYTEANKGTTFSLQIPLSLTINKLLVCQAGSRIYALTADSIEQILLPKSNQIQQTEQGRLLRLTEEELISIYSLSEILEDRDFAGVREEQPDNNNAVLPILLLPCMGQILALEVDRVIGEQELVISPFSRFINVASYVYGGSILADGSLTLAIDAATLLTNFIETKVNTTIDESPNYFMPNRGNNFSLTAASESNNSSKNNNSGGIVKLANNSFSLVDRDRNRSNKSSTQILLVVDDSVTLRQTLAMTLQKEGYQVVQARDGYEAISQFEKNPQINLVICDVEMPRMNGYEFLAHRSTDARLQKVPTIILSSRTAPKHRQLALDLKASAYLTKPYIERELLTTVANSIEQKALI
jgi:two-component system, chemotaxis family, sensor histidine kinase and response regulator PixL